METNPSALQPVASNRTSLIGWVQTPKTKMKTKKKNWCLPSCQHQVLCDLTIHAEKKLIRPTEIPAFADQHLPPAATPSSSSSQNTETLRALQKASGLSPEAEPIKLLSVPKGALAHSLVQRLKLQDNSNGRRHKLAQSASRMQHMRKGSSGSPPRSPPFLNQQVNPERRRLRRGETLEVNSHLGSLDFSPCLKERPLVRCHTLDGGVLPPEPAQPPAHSETD